MVDSTSRDKRAELELPPSAGRRSSRSEPYFTNIRECLPPIQVVMRGGDTRDPEHLRQILLEANAHAALLVNPSGKVLALNRSMTPLVESERPLDVGDSIVDYLPGNLRKRCATLLRRIIRTRVELRFEEHRDGVVVEIAARPVLDEQGDVGAIAFFAADVTQQRREELANARKDAVLEAVAHVAALFLNQTDWEEGIEGVLERLGRAVGADHAFLSQAADQAKGSSLIRHVWNRLDPGTEAPCDPEFAWKPQRWRKKLASGREVAGDTHEFPAIERTFLEAREIESLMLIPVFCRQTWWGVFGACSRSEPRRWQPGETEAVRAATDILGAAISRSELEWALTYANAELHISISRLEESNRSATVLREMNDLLQASQDFESAYRVVSQCAEQMFPNCSGALFVSRDEDDLLASVASWGTPGTLSRTIRKDECWALRRGQPHGVTPKQRKLVCIHAAGSGTNLDGASSLCIPIKNQADVGLLHLISPQAEFPEQQTRLAMDVAGRIGLSIATLSLQETLRRQSTQDPLTGLFNRRHLEKALLAEIKRAARHRSTFCVLMIDIDHFKEINDDFGHDAGDEYLRMLTAYLRFRFRAEDVTCRYGGEEFVVIMPETALPHAEMKTQQMREHARRLLVEHRGKVIGPKTLSVGISCFPAHGETPERLLRVADEAMYEAKRLGRDRTVVAH